MTEASGSGENRSITVGQNVVGSAIVAGDQNQITVTYNEIIKIFTSVALQQHVETIYNHFSNSEELAAERIFLK